MDTANIVHVEPTTLLDFRLLLYLRPMNTAALTEQIIRMHERCEQLYASVSEEDDRENELSQRLKIVCDELGALENILSRKKQAPS